MPDYSILEPFLQKVFVTEQLFPAFRIKEYFLLEIDLKFKLSKYLQ